MTPPFYKLYKKTGKMVRGAFPKTSMTENMVFQLKTLSEGF